MNKFNSPTTQTKRLTATSTTKRCMVVRYNTWLLMLSSVFAHTHVSILTTIVSKHCRVVLFAFGYLRLHVRTLKVIKLWYTSFIWPL